MTAGRHLTTGKENGNGNEKEKENSESENSIARDSQNVEDECRLMLEEIEKDLPWTEPDLWKGIMITTEWTARNAKRRQQSELLYLFYLYNDFLHVWITQPDARC